MHGPRVRPFRVASDLARRDPVLFRPQMAGFLALEKEVLGRERTSCGAILRSFTAIVDIVSKKWITTLLCAEATSVQVKVVFLNALEAEGLLDDLEWRLNAPGDVDLTEEAAPILLAVSG